MMTQNTAVEVIDVKNLLPVSYQDRESFFMNKGEQIQPLIDKVKDYYANVLPSGANADTEDGRKAIKKFAAELNNVIKDIDAIGKSVTDILKAKPKQIDAGRKMVKDQLGELYEQIRAPVLAYEAEQARIKAEAEAKIAEEQRKKDEELAMLRAQAEQVKRDEEIKQQIEESARREAEAKILEAQREAQRVREDAERKERDRLAEIQRQKDEEAKRLADIEHVRKVKNDAFNCLINNGVDRETAIKVITLISENKIDNISIKY